VNGRREFLKVLVATGSAHCLACTALHIVPSTRHGAPPQGDGCCRYKHCRYFPGAPAAQASAEPLHIPAADRGGME
jgi:hypothetical protein